MMNVRQTLQRADRGVVAKTLLTSCALALFSTSTLVAADWRQFRGTGIDGLAASETVPTSWSDSENVAWKLPLQNKGVSGPIVVGSQVFITESSGHKQNRLHVRCLDAATGRTTWERQFRATGRTQCHNKMAVATGTPASDGKRVFAFYSSNDLVCLDLEGNLQWYRALGIEHPNASNSLGMASSPVVVDGVVVAQVESDAEGFAVGVDAQTGKTLWKIERPRAANWTSPTILPRGAGKSSLVLLQSSKGVSAVDVKTGEEAWNYGDGASTIPSSVISEGLVFVPSNGITALRPNDASSAPELVWQENKLGPPTASPLAYKGRLYTVNRAGVLTCAETATGKDVWRLRLKGPFSATPVLAGGHLYFVNEKGLAQVVRLGDDGGEVVTSVELNDRFLSSPAVADGALYIRGDKQLWKIAR